MNLTPEQTDIGKKNFLAAMGSTVMASPTDANASHRDFLRGAIEKNLASKAGLGGYYYGYSEPDRPVRVAVLGTGDEGNVLLGAINPKFIEVVAIADIRPYSISRAFNGDVLGGELAQKSRLGLCRVYGWKDETEARQHVKVFGDYRDLLNEATVKDLGIEAVIIGLPLHLHAPASVAAMRLGLHVLTEKLMAKTVGLCKLMGRVSEETNKLMATGHQRHYNILYENAFHAIQQGLLGDLHYIRAQWHRANLPKKDSWQPPIPKWIIDTKDKKFTDTDLNLYSGLEKQLKSFEAKRDALLKANSAEADVWIKKVEQLKAKMNDVVAPEIIEKAGFKPQKVVGADGTVYYSAPAAEAMIRWRLWNDFGGGLMVELGSHQLDAAGIFISAMHGGVKQMPISVSATSNRPIFPPDRDIDDHIECIFEFPAPGYDPNTEEGRRRKIAVSYSAINGNDFGGYGETVFGTGGTMQINRESDVLLWQTHNVNDYCDVVKVDQAKEKNAFKKKYPCALNVADKLDELSYSYGIQAFQNVSRGYTEELEHWAWLIRNIETAEDKKAAYQDNQPHCKPAVAMSDAILSLVTNIAAKKHEQVKFQKEWFDIHSDATPDGSKVELPQ
ncbi:MAG: Gfo/Idh/MocA family oxidoreductase [Thermoguttaceae bacterium]|nr:Gfo/Idh/MocA family oxidoreductase [Thermoguttaceae bacterium]